MSRDARGAGRHLLLYDEECTFCTAVARGVLALDREGRIESVGLRTPRAVRETFGLTEKERLASFHLISPSGELWSGEEAIEPLLRLVPKARGIRRALADHQSLRRMAGASYRWVARNRSWLSRLVPPRYGRPLPGDGGR